MPDTNKNEQELKTFGITGKLRTGFITGIIGLLVSAVVFLYQENRRLNEQNLDIQERLYERMMPVMKQEVKQEVKQVVTEQVAPIAESVDTATTNLKEFIGGIEK